MRAELCRNLRRNCRDAARQLKSVNIVVKIKRIKHLLRGARAVPTDRIR